MGEIWYIYAMKYYSAIQNTCTSTHTHTHTHTFESVLVRWMNLDPVTQSELSQKEKNKCHILTCIY